MAPRAQRTPGAQLWELSHCTLLVKAVQPPAVLVASPGIPNELGKSCRPTSLPFLFEETPAPWSYSYPKPPALIEPSIISWLSFNCKGTLHEGQETWLRVNFHFHLLMKFFP